MLACFNTFHLKFTRILMIFANSLMSLLVFWGGGDTFLLNTFRRNNNQEKSNSMLLGICMFIRCML